VVLNFVEVPLFLSSSGLSRTGPTRVVARCHMRELIIGHYAHVPHPPLHLFVFPFSVSLHRLPIGGPPPTSSSVADSLLEGILGVLFDFFPFVCPSAPSASFPLRGVVSLPLLPFLLGCLHELLRSTQLDTFPLSPPFHLTPWPIHSARCFATVKSNCNFAPSPCHTHVVFLFFVPLPFSSSRVLLTWWTPPATFRRHSIGTHYTPPIIFGHSCR